MLRVERPSFGGGDAMAYPDDSPRHHAVWAMKRNGKSCCKNTELFAGMALSADRNEC